MSHSNPTISSTLIASSSTANALSVGDIINGTGIPTNSEVLSINYISGGQWEITINQTPIETEVYATGNHNPYTDPSGAHSGKVSWGTSIVITTTTAIDSYNPKTLSFNEQVKGWVSFKSFTPENAISVANDYYTFNNAKLFKHHVEGIDRNTFYEGEVDFPFTASSFNVILNNAPGSVKSFNTLNYEGTQSRVDIDLNDNQYFNLTAKPGWYVESIETDLEKGSLNEFIDKEGKWFNYLKGQNVITNPNGLIVVNPDGSSSFDQSSFAIQGIGVSRFINDSEIECERCDEGQLKTEMFSGINICPEGWVPVGTASPCSEVGEVCNCDGAVATFVLDQNNDIAWSVVLPPEFGMWKMEWYNDDGVIGPWLANNIPNDSGIINQSGYNNYAFAVYNNNQLTGVFSWYCMATESWECVSSFTITLPLNGGLTCYQCDGSELSTSTTNYEEVGDGFVCPQGWTTTMPNCGGVFGCMDSYAINYNQFATVDDGSCTYIGAPIPGCTDMTASNYDPLADVDDGSCLYVVVPPVTCDTVTGTQFEGCGDWNNVMNGVSNNTLPGITAHWYNILTAGGYQTLANGQPFTFANLQALLGGNPPTPGCCGEPASGQDLFGCMDPNAQNYSPLANVDDGNCCYTTGCWQ